MSMSPSEDNFIKTAKKNKGYAYAKGVSRVVLTMLSEDGKNLSKQIDIPITISTPEDDSYEIKAKRALQQFKNYALDQITFFTSIINAFDEIYNNYLDINEMNILSSSRMIRVLMVILQYEENIINALKIPNLNRISEKIDKDVLKETGLFGLDITTNKLYEARNRKVAQIRNELNKIENQVKVELIERRSNHSKPEEKELRKQFHDLEQDMEKLKKNLGKMRDNSKIIVKNLKGNIKKSKKKTKNEKRVEVFNDYINILRRVQEFELEIIKLLDKYETYWENFQNKVSNRLSKVKLILQSYMEFQKSTFYNTIKLQKGREVLRTLDPTQFSGLIFCDKQLLSSVHLKELGIESETVSELKNKIMMRFKKVPSKIEFCRWDHFNPHFFNFTGKKSIKYRFFWSNEVYFYVYEFKHRFELPRENKPVFVCNLKNLNYKVVRGRASVKTLILKSKSGLHSSEGARTLTLFFKFDRELYDLIAFLVKYAQRDAANND